MPLYRRLPRGFKTLHKNQIKSLNLSVIEKLYKLKNRFEFNDKFKVITRKKLLEKIQQT